MKKERKEFSDETKKILLRAARYRCQNPECKSRSRLTFHHKKKRSSQGENLNSPENGCVLCQDCHMRAENPRNDDERWRFSVFNTLKWQKIGDTEREHLEWEHREGIRDWRPFLDKEIDEN